MNSAVLLATADRQVERFTTTNDVVNSFEDSLYEAILFREKAVLPDIFAFISSAISKMYGSSQKTHLDYALEAGYVIPAFRGELTSFEQSFDLISSQGIQGVQGAPNFVASRLDESLSKSTEKHIPWPRDLSVQFGSMLITALNRIVEVGGSGHSVVGSNFSLSAKFIADNGIIELTRESLCYGELRRGDFYNLILKRLERLESTGVTKVHDCYGDLVCHPSCQKNPSIAVAVHNIVVLANTLYQQNMAMGFSNKENGFSVNNYLPGRLFADAALPALETALAISNDIAKSSDATCQVEECLDITVRIPSVSQLRALSWKQLLDIRDDVGYGYFSALPNWHKNPGQFEHLLRSYSEALTSFVQSEVPPVKVLLRKFSSRERKGVQAVGKQAMDLVAQKAVGENIMGVIGVVSSFMFSWATERPVALRFMANGRSSIAV